MKRISKMFAFMIVGLLLSTTTLLSATFNLSTRAWGAWGNPSSGVKKTDSNNGWFKVNSQSAWSGNYADAFYNGKRASNSYYRMQNENGTFITVWFSYVGGQNSVFNGKEIQCRVASSNTDPNPGSVNITFEP